LYATPLYPLFLKRLAVVLVAQSGKESPSILPESSRMNITFGSTGDGVTVASGCVANTTLDEAGAIAMATDEINEVSMSEKRATLAIDNECEVAGFFGENFFMAAS
jgi:hypothetical protein